MKTWVVIAGSPYAEGRCTTLGRTIAKQLDAQADTRARFFAINSLDIHGCIGCDRCKDTFTCIYDDDLPTVVSALDEADALLIISPIYFAGVPSQFKALLDRFQPFFWKRRAQIDAGIPLPAKRPLYLALVGEGGDPYGTEHARALVASPAALADFEIRATCDFIHCDKQDIYEQLVSLIDRANKELALLVDRPDDERTSLVERAHDKLDRPIHERDEESHA